MAYPEPLSQLIRVLSRLPGLGRRSAERIAVKLAQQPGRQIGDLMEALERMRKGVVICSQCGSFTAVESNPCGTCCDGSRDDTLLCVVEYASDQIQLENSGGFRGRYFCLNGKLSPMNGEGIQDLPIQRLIRRIDSLGVQEVMLALNRDVESDATSSCLMEVLREKNIKITRLAFGIPAGSGIAYADDVTLHRAIQGRQTL